MEKRKRRRYVIATKQEKVEPPEGFEFIHIPKTAGTSICRALGFQDSHNPAAYRLAHEKDFERKKVATFIRNPWQRALSWFLYARPHALYHCDFKRWVMDDMPPHWQWQGGSPRMLYQEDWIEQGGKLIVHFIGRFENLEVDFIRLCKWVGREYEKNSISLLQHYHKKSRNKYPYSEFPKPYYEYWDEEMIDKANETFKYFIAKYDYVFGE